jgi:hypothetical protein
MARTAVYLEEVEHPSEQMPLYIPNECPDCRQHTEQVDIGERKVKDDTHLDAAEATPHIPGCSLEGSRPIWWRLRVPADEEEDEIEVEEEGVNSHVEM